jgi:hypothetical protein
MSGEKRMQENTIPWVIKIFPAVVGAILALVLSGLDIGDEVINNSLFLYDADAMTNRLYDETSNEEW